MKDKLRKVLALAQSGQAGERENAQMLLEKLLFDKGLTLADLDESEVEIHWFKTGRSADMKDLIAQIYFMVTDTHSADVYRNKRHPGCIGLKVTRIQAADIESYYSVLAPALKKELNRYRCLVRDSFFQKHGLFAQSEGPHEKLTPEEIEYLKQVWQFQNAIDRVDFRRQIERQTTRTAHHG